MKSKFIQKKFGRSKSSVSIREIVDKGTKIKNKEPICNASDEVFSYSILSKVSVSIYTSN